MKIPKIRSYFRLVLVFFSLLAVFFIFQSLIIHYGFWKTILPRYLQEKQEMLQFIKTDIRFKAEHNPRFDLESYIAKENQYFHRAKLAFVSRVRRVQLEGGDYRYQIVVNRKRIWAAAEKLSVGSRSGYLVF